MIENQPSVELDKFQPLLDESTHIVGEGMNLLQVRSSFGNIYLVTNVDLNEGYERLR